MKEVFLVFIGLLGLLSCTDNQIENTEAVNSQSDNETKQEGTEHETLVLGERIDGPANLRDAINGKKILSIEDDELVECTEMKDNWYRIGLYVPITKEQYDSYEIKKGNKIFYKNKLVCTVLEDLELYMADEYKENGTIEYSGIIEGYTHKNNIKPASIPERELEKILNSKTDLTKKDFEWYLKNFRFENYGLEIKGFEKADQYMIYGTRIEDPSPIDRLRLIFDSNKLIAVIHERTLEMKGKKSYDLVRGLEILIVKEFEEKGLRNFIESNKNSYRGVD